MSASNITKNVFLQTILFLAHQQKENSSLETLYNLPPGAKVTDLSEIKCYGVYGCFPITEQWYSETRPYNVYPKSPSEIRPRFPVFTNNSRQTPKFIDLNDPNYVQQLGINSTGNIYFVTHGYVETGDRPWIQRLVNKLLDHDGTATVIVIDWELGSPGPYVQACANIRLVGAMAAHVIHLLYDELKLPNLNKVHMMGHSLGSHLCGYTGYTLIRDFNLTLGRITGLDPAEPFFSDVDPLVRLDRTDALFVDIVHSHAKSFAHGGMGLAQAIGHIDFYPNGGFDNPGCGRSMDTYINDEQGSFYWGIQQYISCDHMRSYQFFTESIGASAKCPFTAISCESYEKFVNGDCFECNRDGDYHCFEFGMNSYKSYRRRYEVGYISGSRQIKAYLMTSDKKPFCRAHYKTTLFISPSTESAMHGGEIGIMSIIIHSLHPIYITEKIPFTSTPIFYEPGQNYTSVTPGSNVGVPRYATLHWEYRTSPLNPLTWRILSSPRVYIDYIILETLEHQSRIRLCSVNGEPVISDHPTDFREEYCERNN